MKNVKIKRYISWYLLLLIPMVGTLVFNFYPLIQTMVTSLQNMNGKFIGFTNYRIMFASSEFKQTVINTLYMAVLGVAFNIPLAFIIASLLNNIGRGKGIYRVIFLLPMVMSMVTVVTLFKYLMLPNEEGVFNYIIGVLGFEPSLWLNGTGTARESVVFIAVWKGIGYNVILFFAGLQGIPADMYEAAEIAALKRFTEVYAVSMETGNPAGRLETLLLYIYKNSFSTLNYKDEGLAGAASVVLFLIILAATLVNSHLTKEKEVSADKPKRRGTKA